MRIPAFVTRLWRNWIVGVIVILEGVVLWDTTFPRDLAAEHRLIASYVIMGAGSFVIVAAFVHAFLRTFHRTKQPPGSAA